VYPEAQSLGRRHDPVVDPESTAGVQLPPYWPLLVQAYPGAQSLSPRHGHGTHADEYDESGQL